MLWMHDGSTFPLDQLPVPPVWPPDYVAEFAERQRRLNNIRSDKKIRDGAREYYRTRPAEFINDWCITYDPRVAMSGRPTRMPFIMFPRQVEMVEFLQACMDAETPGLIEKCRDAGATWICVGFSVWLFLFIPGVSIGWGSRKEQLVDKIGDPDSIFEKIRMMLRSLPKEFLPVGFNEKTNAPFMKITNPESDATITGEAGDNIGRGGRSSIYFKDESAHYERPEKIEAALGENTRVQIDISSVNGLGNVFHRTRESGVEWEGGAATPEKTNVFVFDVFDHPEKDQKWYDARRRSYESRGLLHVFAQEIDRDYAASVEGVVIPAAWVKSAIDAHLKIDGWDDSGAWFAAQDVADGGSDTNAFCARKGMILRKLEEWAARDTGVTARKMINHVTSLKSPRVVIQYDSIGVGAGVKAEVNRLDKDEKVLPKGHRFVAWDAGAAPLFKDDPMIKGDPTSVKNGDFYANLKAQGWWKLRRMFEKTHDAVTRGIKYPIGEMISIDSNLPKLRQLQKELSQPTMGQTTRGKLLIDKQPEGVTSPNLADSVMMCYWPAKSHNYTLENL